MIYGYIVTSYELSKHKMKMKEIERGKKKKTTEKEKRRSFVMPKIKSPAER